MAGTNDLTRNDHYLDNVGLKNVWDAIKDNFVAKQSGKGLSTNDYTTTEKNKLAGIASGAEVNVQSDWNTTDSSSDAYIKNKPTSLKNPNSLSIGGKSYDGSSAVSVTLTDLNVYSKTEVDGKLSAQVKYSVVSTLPDTGEAGTIYLKPSSSSVEGDVYDEFMWVPADGTITAHFEKIGSTKSDISSKQDKLPKKGSTTKPIYTSAEGTIAECSTYAGGSKVTLNGTAKGGADASFYAPTGAGTSGQYLKSNGSGAPSWETMDTTPTASSTKAVTSGGIKSYVDTADALKVNKADFITDTEIASVCTV